jgi:cytoskeletal protein CcmA (bactofilin family)
MSVFGFFILLLTLLMLPFIPGIMEIRRKQDAEPLRVARHYDVDIHYFANRFHTYIKTHFAQSLAALHSQAQTLQGELEDGSRYCLVAREAALAFERPERHAQVTTRMFIANADLELPGAMSYLNELYANGSIAGADENIYRAMFAGTDIALGQHSMLLRWMHAQGAIRLANGCIMYGRVSADKRIVFAGQAQFRRLNAPQIQFGKPLPAPAPTTQARKEIQPEELPVEVEVAAGRWLIEDDLELPDNSCIHANLVVTGSLRLGDNCEIHGSIKSHKTLRIQAGCAIHGSVVSMQDIHLGTATSLKGPLISEAQIHVVANCRIGTETLPTTVSAEEIHIQGDCVAHGTVWARSAGTLS